jgi:hypothetical protein
VIHFTVGRIDSPLFDYYSQRVAFPLLMTCLAIGSVAIGFTHPKKTVQLAQADAHTKMAVNAAETASRLALIEANTVLSYAQRAEEQAKTEQESFLLDQLDARLNIREKRIARIAAVRDPELREQTAREFGINLPESRPQSNAPAQSVTGELLGSSTQPLPRTINGATRYDDQDFNQRQQ